MPLSNTVVRKATPQEKPYRLTDGNGMYLEVAPSGSKCWHLKYRFAGKEKRLALGAYPAVMLASARKKPDDDRTRLAEGIDPGEARKTGKRITRMNAENSFEAIARKWLFEFAMLRNALNQENLRNLKIRLPKRLTLARTNLLR